MRTLSSLAAFLILILPAFVSAQGKADPLDGKRFTSIEKLSGGLAPNGVVAKIHYSISFKNGTFTWNHSDVSESGSYKFDGKTGAIQAAPKTGKRKYTGSYDARTGILTWQKQKYKVK